MYSKSEIESLLEIIKDRFENNLNKIILFGRYSENTAREESDLDIAIITNDELERKEKLNKLNWLWVEASGKGLSVDFIIKPLSKYEEDLKFPTLSKTINEKGKILWQIN